jgi:hypothetical protein
MPAVMSTHHVLQGIMNFIQFCNFIFFQVLQFLSQQQLKLARFLDVIQTFDYFVAVDVI